MPPPLPPALLAEKVLFVTETVPRLLIPPPKPPLEALFAVRVLFLTVTVPPLRMPPPTPLFPCWIVSVLRVAVNPLDSENPSTPPLAVCVPQLAVQPPSTTTVCPLPS